MQNGTAPSKPKRHVAKVYESVTFFSPCVLYLLGFFKPRNFSSDRSSRSAMFLSSRGAVRRACRLIGWRRFNPAYYLLNDTRVDQSLHSLFALWFLHCIASGVSLTSSKIKWNRKGKLNYYTYSIKPASYHILITHEMGYYK